MKWGRKKSNSAAPSSSPASIILSWFFNLRQSRGSSESKKQRGGFYYPTPSKSLPGGWKEGRFYSMGEDDAYWRISFSQERIQGRKSTGGMNLNPLWYDSDLEFEVPISGFKGAMEVVRRGGGYRNFDAMVSDIKRMKDRQGKDKTRNDGELAMIQRQKDQKLTKLSSGVLEHKILSSVERDVFPVERDDWKSAASNARKKQSKVANIRVSSVKEDYVFEEPLANRKLKEIKLKPDLPQRKSTKQHNRAKAYSPRTECKIRALEDMKKSRMKWKKKGGETIFDSFAVVKNSSNPQQDFRDSMVEMIREKHISRAEELEELLACYLTLNCDAYHDLIVKVFRQVWSELNVASSDDPWVQNSQYFAY